MGVGECARPNAYRSLRLDRYEKISALEVSRINRIKCKIYVTVQSVLRTCSEKRDNTVQKKIFNKLNRKGMTLIETLVAMLILGMVTSVVAGGIPTAVNAYEKIVLASNAEVLLSTTISKLRNEISTASEIEVDESKKTITYYSAIYNTFSKIFSADGTSDKIKNYDGTGLKDGDTFPEHAAAYQMYAKSKTSNKEGPITYLISTEAATGDLFVSFESVEYRKDVGIVTFTNLSVDRLNGMTGLAARDTYSIRVINSDSST